MKSSVTARFNSAVTKLNRAYEHIEELKGEVKTFFDSKPYSVEGVFENDGRKLVEKVRLIRKPSDKFGVLIGDAAFNLRACLDHLIWQLSDQPTDDKIAQHIQFPVYAKRRTYLNNVERRLHGVTPLARSEIEKFQPFKRKYTLWTGQIIHRFSPHPLAVLNEICNTDKHRLIHAAGLWLIQTKGHAHTTTGEPATVSRWVRQPGPFPDGAKLLEWEFPHTQVHVQTAYSFDVTTRLAKSRTVVVPAVWLASIEQFIREEIVPSLARPECLRP